MSTALKGTPLPERLLPGGRMEELDLVKGMLVVGMLLFHSASATHNDDARMEGITFHLDFLHTAFIALSGFLCGTHYALAASSGLGASGRLLRRALKLLAVFLGANLALVAFGTPKQLSWTEAARTPASAFRNFILSMNAECAAFIVIYYIAVFLAVAAALMGGNRRLRLAAALAAGLLGAQYSQTLWYVCVGLIGLGGGLAYLRHRERALSFASRYWWVVLALLFAYHAAAKRTWTANGGLLWLLGLLVGETCLWFWVIFGVFRWLPPGRARSIILLMGRDTLLAYLGQMLILEALHATFTRHISGVYSQYVLNLVLAATALCVGLALLERWRRRNPIVNQAYRSVFH